MRKWMLVVLGAAVLFTHEPTPARAERYTITDLGSLGGGYSWATDVNNLGQVVGWARTADGADRAFLYSEGQMTDLGTFGGKESRADGINDAGHVVGMAQGKDQKWRPFLYRDGQMIDLYSLISSEFPWQNLHVLAINEKGQMVGDGINP